MTLFELFAVLISFTAILAWINTRWLRLPPAIGVLASALAFSIVLTLAGRLGLAADAWAEALVDRVDFDDLLMRGMLSFLLFAGALHVDLGRLLERKWPILTMATGGVLLSTFLIGGGFRLLSGLVGLELDWISCLLFGALISPTDPVAVLGLLRGARVPERMETTIVGESLFNDGVAVVLFVMLLDYLERGGERSLSGAALLFAQEALGGALLGLVLGLVAYMLLRAIDDRTVEILITVALVAGGYTLARTLHASGPIAMVVAGLFIGNHGRKYAMSERTTANLDTFWEVIDEILNALLFVLIGLELLILDLEPAWLLAAALAIPLMLAVRALCVALPVAALREGLPRGTIALLTWGGLRGGISIALALSLPDSPARAPLLVATYTVVVFSILVQGLTLGRVARRLTTPA